MFVQGIGGVASAYAPTSPAAGRQKPPDTFVAVGTASTGTQVMLSDQAKAAADADGIHTRLAEITAKPESAQTAEDIDYMQKAGGFVNTMANLSSDEKKLYNELVAQGNTEAVRGMNLLALSRMGGGEVTLPDGASFDPTKTAITPENIRKLFSQMFASDDGQDAKSFEALASYLDTRKSAAA